MNFFSFIKTKEIEFKKMLLNFYLYLITSMIDIFAGFI